MLDVKNKIIPLLQNIEKITPDDFTFMEVCGTHTMSIARYGLRSLLPKRMRIISGPGCPVCVSSSKDIRTAIQIAKLPNTIVATFGDMLRVPCEGESLQEHKNVKVIYSPMESLVMAEKNRDKEVVLLGVGFETTSPLTAVVIKEAEKRGLNNFFVLCMHKLIPQAMELIMQSKNINLNGFLLPGHVSAITGSRYFDFISKFDFCGVVTGFEPVNIVSSISMLVTNHVNSKYGVFNNYEPVVNDAGNLTAQGLVKDVYEPCDSDWRGIGKIKASGLKIKRAYSRFDATNKFNIKMEKVDDPKGCRCGDILKGNALPTECMHYGRSCTPSNPIGPCMVSTEGTCAAFYKYVED